MLWNVYVIDDGECRKLNSEPYDADMVGAAIEHLENAQSVTLIPCSPPAKTFDELYSSIRAASGNAWDDVENVEAELAAMRGDDSAETEGQS